MTAEILTLCTSPPNLSNWTPHCSSSSSTFSCTHVSYTSGMFFFKTHRLCSRFVTFADGHNQWHLSSSNQIHTLSGLNHHPIISCHHQNHYISQSGSPSSHGREGCMPGGVQECQSLTSGQLHCTQVLVRQLPFAPTAHLRRHQCVGLFPQPLSLPYLSSSASPAVWSCHGPRDP